MNNDFSSVKVICKYSRYINKSFIGSGCLPHAKEFDCWKLGISCQYPRKIDWIKFLINSKHLKMVEYE